MGIIPALQKSYSTTYLNQTQVATGTLSTTLSKVLFGIVSAYKAIGFTEVSSCNSVTVGTGTWTSFASLVFSSGAHSWIVLKNTAVGGAQICIDCNPTPYQMGIAFSAGAGFTGGSTSARPTATDQQAFTNIAWAPSSDSNMVWHLIASTDATISRLFVLSSGTQYLYLPIEVPTTPSDLATAWSSPVIAGPMTVSTVATLVNAANLWGRINGTNTALECTCESCGAGLLPLVQTFADDNTADWPFWPIGVYSVSSPNRGHKGNLVDVGFGAHGVSMGASYPQTGGSGANSPYQWVQFGDLVVPWYPPSSSSPVAPLIA